jgi:hypothetical protein
MKRMMKEAGELRGKMKAEVEEEKRAWMEGLKRMEERQDVKDDDANAKGDDAGTKDADVNAKGDEASAKDGEQEAKVDNEETVRSSPMTWGEAIGYDDEPKHPREMDEILDFISRKGEFVSGRWEILPCGCSAFLLDWTKPADRAGIEHVPSLYSPCCDLVVLRTELAEFPDKSGNATEALISRHKLDCPLYSNCIEHAY